MAFCAFWTERVLGNGPALHSCFTCRRLVARNAKRPADKGPSGRLWLTDGPAQANRQSAPHDPFEIADRTAGSVDHGVLSFEQHLCSPGDASQLDQWTGSEKERPAEAGLERYQTALQARTRPSLLAISRSVWMWRARKSGPIPFLRVV